MTPAPARGGHGRPDAISPPRFPASHFERLIHVPLYTPCWEWVFAVRPEVEGFFVAPFVYPVFSDVRL